MTSPTLIAPDGLQDALRAEAKYCMKASGLSQADVARALYVTPKHLSAMLGGRANFSPEWAQDIARVCGRELIVLSRALPLEIDRMPPRRARDLSE